MKYLFIILTLCSIVFYSGDVHAQGKITRKKTEKYQLNPPVSKQSVKYKKTHGLLNGHEWIDLGLPSGTKWSTCNIGAYESWEGGSYFSWGDIDVKSNYTRENYNFNLKPKSIIGDINHDAASYNWGREWTMPSIAQLSELINNCKWEFYTINGITGYLGTGPNKNQIFLPTTGLRYGNSDTGGNYGRYYSGMSNREDVACIYFENDQKPYIFWFGGWSGFAIRPVCSK